MTVNAIDKLFELQHRLVLESQAPTEAFLKAIEEHVQEQHAISNTVFTKLLDSWRGLELSELERIFELLRQGADSCLRSSPEAAFSFFKAAQECSRRLDAYYGAHKAA